MRSKSGGWGEEAVDLTDISFLLVVSVGAQPQAQLRVRFVVLGQHRVSKIAVAKMEAIYFNWKPLDAFLALIFPR